MFRNIWKSFKYICIFNCVVICLRCTCKNLFYFSPFRRQYLHIILTVPLYTCKRGKGVSVLLYVTGSNQFYREARLGNTSIYAVYMQIRKAPFLNSAVINKTYMASTNQKSCADPGFFPRGGSEGCIYLFYRIMWNNKYIRFILNRT